MEKITNRFRVKSEAGREFEIVEIQEYQDASDLDGPKTIKGLRRFETLSGDPLNFIDDQSFKVVFTNEIVRKV